MAMQFNATTSLCYNPDSTALDYNQITFMCAFYATGTGEGGAGVVMVADDALNAWNILTVSGPALSFRWKHSTNQGRWNRSFSLNRWYWLAITYDRTSNSNDPKFYLRDFTTDNKLQDVTPTEIDAPSGTATTPALGWAVGNLNDGSATFDGYISRPRIYSRILSLEECEAEFRRPGSITNGLRLHIDDRGADLSGSGRGATTYSNITIANGNGPGSFSGFSTPLWLPYTVSGGGGGSAISGTSAGAASTSGALTGLGALAAISDGVATTSAALTALGALSGTSDGLATTTALLTALGALAGTSDGLATVSAAMLAIMFASGTSDGQATTSGNLTGLGAMSGTSDGLATTLAALIGLGALSGASAGQATVSGTLFSEFIQGLAEGIATVSGTLTGIGSLSGSSDGLATVSALLNGLAPISGQIAGLATADGTLVGLGSLSGIIAGAGSVAATLTGLGALSGAISGAASVSGSLIDSDNPPRRIHTIAFNNKPFGAVVWIPKQHGNIQTNSH